MTFEAFERMRRVLDNYRSTTDDPIAEVTWNDGYEIRFSLPKDIDWMKRGACCRNDDGVNWFPNVGESADPAQAVCSSCIVQSMCREHAISHHELGIWGGTTEQDRSLIRRTRRLSN
jgi:hypothetical protein